MLLSEIRAQNTAVATLARALAQDRLPNAYLFDGPSGVGKQRAALALAKARLCAARPLQGCHDCSACRRIEEAAHPDVRVFAPREEGSRNIQVHTLREEILKIAQFAPFEASHAFLIFPDADVSFPIEHPEAANALLKTLEEPRLHVSFILLSARAERLLSTIRSRCQRVRFGRLPRLVLEQVLEAHDAPRAQWDAAVALSEGQADRALALAQAGGAAELLERALQIDQLLARGEPGRIVSLSEDLAKAGDLPRIVETLSGLYADVARHGLGASASSLRFQSALDSTAERARTLSPERAADHVRRLSQLSDLLAQNANPQITLDHLLFSLR